MRRYLGIVIFIVLGVIGLISFYLFSEDDLVKEEMYEEDEELVSLDRNTDDQVEVELEQTDRIIVDIKGAIESPGVYEMEHGDRLVDLIHQAGGFTKQANETEINLAQRLQDEMVVIVPKEGETPTEAQVSSSVGANETSKQQIHLNQATQDELETLNGIGPSKAQAIVDYREENGPFQSIEEVLEVSGIGEKTLASFEEDIIVP